MPDIVPRKVDAAAEKSLVAGGCDPRFARLYAARGVSEVGQLSQSLAHLIAPGTLAHVEDAARLLADAIGRTEKLLIVADYDADGATACAVGVMALRAFGASVDYLVPNRFEFGYGLTPEIVRLAHERRPDWLITVDNGIASVDGVAEANRLGMRVLVTDHHLPGDVLPAAACIVNPNQAGCGFPSKNLAGVGVIFYVMLALRAELRKRGHFAGRAEPNLAGLLDIVALGTVADVVKLDANNRILVAQGLSRVRTGKAHPGVNALLEIGGRRAARVSASDFGFVVGPRLNAAGRMDDMSLGIECLLAETDAAARDIAAQLDRLNRERREVEAGMQESALAMLEKVDAGDGFSLVMHRPEWHPGVVGLLASRLKDRTWRPVIAFARDGETMLKGSGRSIAGLHVRDALDQVSKRAPGVIERFGGHAAAAGVSIHAAQLAAFEGAFEDVCRSLLTADDLKRRIETDGALAPEALAFAFARDLRAEVWGQGFPEPRFTGAFRVEDQRVVGERHLKLVLGAGGQRFGAMLFGAIQRLPGTIEAVYRLDTNEWQGAETLQLTLEHWH
jgi:single-stranded-DNA-specific exonuclease